MKRIIMAFVLLVGTSTVFAGPALATEVPTPDVCYEQVVDQPAHDEQVIDTPAVPGKDAVTKTEFEFEHHDEGHDNSYKTRWEDDPNWNAESNPKSKGWKATGNTRVVELEPAVPAVEATYKTVTVPATYKDIEVPCAEEPPVDVCPDIEGDQPEGTDCSPVVPPVDVCPDVEGNQPEGTDCSPIVPPVDVCPGVEGDQPEGTDCSPVVPPVDVCPGVEGDQPESTDCAPIVPPVDQPPVKEPPTEVVPPVKDIPKADIGTPATASVNTVLPDTGGAAIAFLLLGSLLMAAGLGIVSTVRLHRNK